MCKRKAFQRHNRAALQAIEPEPHCAQQELTTWFDFKLLCCSYFHHDSCCIVSDYAKCHWWLRSPAWQTLKLRFKFKRCSTHLRICFQFYSLIVTGLWYFHSAQYFLLLHHLWQEGKGECAAARCKGVPGRGNMAGVGFDPIPLRATHFPCMTECMKTGSNGYLGEYKDLTGKDRNAQVLHYFLCKLGV